MWHIRRVLFLVLCAWAGLLVAVYAQVRTQQHGGVPVTGYVLVGLGAVLLFTRRSSAGKAIAWGLAGMVLGLALTGVMGALLGGVAGCIAGSIAGST